MLFTILFHRSIPAKAISLEFNEDERAPSVFEGLEVEHGHVDFSHFFRWFRTREDLENKHRLEGDPSHRDRQLEAVRQSIISLIPGVESLRIKREPPRMEVVKDGQRLRLEQLSDCEKCTFAMVGDIARRLAQANPDNDTPLEKSGIVLIDEVAQHLHPGWQRDIVPGLERTFPGCQFILTTHSPQVLGSLPRESVCILDNFVLVNSPPTQGRGSNSILLELMGLSIFPKETQDALEAISVLMEDETFSEAQDRIDELAEYMGEHDPKIVSQRTMLSFLKHDLDS